MSDKVVYSSYQEGRESNPEIPLPDIETLELLRTNRRKLPGFSYTCDWYKDGRIQEEKTRTLESRLVKYLCLGGQYDGEYRASSQIHCANDGYQMFNASGGRNNAHKAVWIHDSMLYETK